MTRRAASVSAGVTAFFCALGAARVARGEEHHEPPPVQSTASSAMPFQLGVALGYTQRSGEVAPPGGREAIASGGLDVNVSVDHRTAPSWSVGLNLDFLGFGSDTDANASSVAANLGATYHFEPTSAGDPWLRLGTGYRLLWINDPPGATGATLLRHGFQLLTLRTGYDVRIVEGVAVGPLIGAELNALIWDDAYGRSTALPGATVEAFFLAGIQGRFGAVGNGS
jgi:hypothetical protein